MRVVCGVPLLLLFTGGCLVESAPGSGLAIPVDAVEPHMEVEAHVLVLRADVTRGMSIQPVASDVEGQERAVTPLEPTP